MVDKSSSALGLVASIVKVQTIRSKVNYRPLPIQRFATLFLARVLICSVMLTVHSHLTMTDLTMHSRFFVYKLKEQGIHNSQTLTAIKSGVHPVT